MLLISLLVSYILWISTELQWHVWPLALFSRVSCSEKSFVLYSLLPTPPLPRTLASSILFLAFMLAFPENSYNWNHSIHTPFRSDTSYGCIHLISSSYNNAIVQRHKEGNLDSPVIALVIDNVRWALDFKKFHSGLISFLEYFIKISFRFILYTKLVSCVIIIL